YKIVITFKEDNEVSQEVISHQIAINEILQTENIKKLRRRTKGNLANSYTGLYYILQWVLEIIKDENIEEILKKRNALSEKKEKKLRRRTKSNLANSYTRLYYIIQWVLEIIKDENIEEILKKRNALSEKKEKVKNDIDKEEKTKQELQEKIEELDNDDNTKN